MPKIRGSVPIASAWLACAGALVSPGAARAQAFAEAAASRARYSQAELMPSMACDGIRAASEQIAELTAKAMPVEGAAPAHCRVEGVLKPEIAFEVSLPAKWNGRFYMIGNGGHAGESLADPGRVAQRNAALALGFAFAQTNTGHDARKEPGGSFVLGNPQKAIDYAYRAVHLTATTAKAITAKYYGREASHAYWNSCSNGGRQGLIEAQRFPEDFDGIVANAPWVDQTGFTIGALWNQRALDEAPLSAAKLELVAARVMATCDAVDGLEDGLIDDPRACRFDPARDVPACRAGADADDCLTSAQAATVAKIQNGVVSNGAPYFPGYLPGSEAVAGLFGGGRGGGALTVVLPAPAGAIAADFNLADNTMKYLVFTPPRPDWDYRTFDFDHDPPLLTAWGLKANPKNPDLAAFRAHGGKLIVTYGWADSILQPLMGVNYYERAVEKNGPDTRDFFRLFMVPGMAHCAGGIGPDRYDAVSAVIDWVEAGRAPTSMEASKAVDGKVVRTRPLCPYPEVARYTGRGSIDEASSFRCVAP
jgi:Tannase and feruloyl esterase